MKHSTPCHRPAVGHKKETQNYEINECIRSNAIRTGAGNASSVRFTATNSISSANGGADVLRRQYLLVLVNRRVGHVPRCRVADCALSLRAVDACSRFSRRSSPRAEHRFFDPLSEHVYAQPTTTTSPNRVPTNDDHLDSTQPPQPPSLGNASGMHKLDSFFASRGRTSCIQSLPGPHGLRSAASMQSRRPTVNPGLTANFPPFGSSGRLRRQPNEERGLLGSGRIRGGHRMTS